MEKKHALALAKHKRIERERLLLRPVSIKDAEDMYEYASDEETTYYVFPRHESIEQTREGIASYFEANPLGKYALELKESGKMIGTIDLRLKDWKHKAQIGYAMNKAYEGNGYMTEAGKAIRALAFEVLELERLEALHDERNETSGRVMERLGMVREGVERHVDKWKNGEWFNDVHYSLLKEEYEALNE